MKKLFIFFGVLVISSVAMSGNVEITAVEALQRYPWNGLVDVHVTLQGTVADIAKAECLFSAINNMTKETLRVTNIAQNGADSGSGSVWTRKFIWDAKADIGSARIDDVSLTTVCGVGCGGVQLWANGPCWAECNVGATQPESYGYYFWWGDTVGYKRIYYDRWDPPYCWSSSDGRVNEFYFSSFNCESVYGRNDSQLFESGYIDKTRNLVPAHDAATVHVGAPWRMPTDEELAALFDNCEISFTTQNGVNGLHISGKGVFSKRSIFLPASGLADANSWRNTGLVGEYWSSTPKLGNSYHSMDMSFRFTDSSFRVDSSLRSYGHAIRPVRDLAIGSEVGLAHTTHVRVDCRDGERPTTALGEELYYDANWYENGRETRITDNGTLIVSGRSGIKQWVPADCGCHQLLLTILDDKGGEVGRASADFVYEHTCVTTKTAVVATCAHAGRTAEIVCSRCGILIKASEVIPILETHGDNVRTVSHRIEPTCVAVGRESISVCRVCGKTITDGHELPKAPHHEVVTIEEAEPTCEEKGRTKESHCSECGLILSRSVELPALGHHYGPWVVAKMPTDWEDGVKKSYCIGCLRHGHQNAITQELGCWEIVGGTKGSPWQLTGNRIWYHTVDGSETVWTVAPEQRAWIDVVSPDFNWQFESVRSCPDKECTEMQEWDFFIDIDASGNYIARGACPSWNLWACDGLLRVPPVLGGGQVASLGHEAFECFASYYESENVLIPSTVTTFGGYFSAEKRNIIFCGNAPYDVYGELESLGDETTIWAECNSDGWNCDGDGYWNGVRLKRYHRVHGYSPYEWPYCINCGEWCGDLSEDRIVVTSNHSGCVGEWNTGEPPTCEENGCLQTYTCAYCHKRVQGCPVDHLGHNLVLVQEYQKATCVEDGHEGVMYCSVCGEIWSHGATIPKGVHRPDGESVVVAATCSKPGVSVETHCQDCGTLLSVDGEVPPLGHLERILEDPVAVTCTQNGYTGCSDCMRCGEKIRKGEVIPKGHTERIVIEAVVPSCTTAGRTAEVVCTRCNETLQSSVVHAALGHARETVIAAVAASCTMQGRTEAAVCTRCNATLATSKTLAALGHNRQTTISAIAPTCTTVGRTAEIKCSRCGEIFETSRSLDALGHVATVTKPVIPATSGSSGRTEEIRCSRCNELFQAATEIPALGYIRNVTAWQLWPHKKVEVAYTLADDIDDVVGSGASLTLASSSGATARTVIGDTSAKPGAHCVVWDMEKDGISVISASIVLTAAYGNQQGKSGATTINTSSSVKNGMSVANSMTLGYSPIDAGVATIKVNGQELLSSTNSGVFAWQPKTTGTHTIEHIAGTNHWTRTVNVTSLAFAQPPTPNPPTVVDANIRLGASARSVVAAGGTVSITTSGSGTWNATTSADWITFNGASSKAAGLSCIVRVAANTGVESRTGYVYVSGHVFTITQAGVGAELDSYSSEFGPDGGEGEVLVLSDGQVSWTVKPESEWISVRETSGTGEAYVHFAVAPLASVTDRTGYITIAGRTYEVHQVGRALSISRLRDVLDFQSHPVEIDVSAFRDTEWYVTPFGSWISVVAPVSGFTHGSDKVLLTVNENPSYLPRSGYVTIGTERYDVTQRGRPPAALAFAISPERTTASVNGANGLIAVSATPDLPWTAMSQANWLTVMPTFREGTGDGNVVYTATPNSTMSERTGTIVVSAEAASEQGTRTHAVVQPAAAAAIAIEEHTFAAEGDSFELEVTVGDNVNWTIVKNASWITVDGRTATTTSRIGPGNVRIAVAENQAVEPRTAKIMVAGHSFMVVQRGRTVEVEYVSRIFDAEGGDGTIEVHPNGTVNWTAVSSDWWLTIWAEDGASDNFDGSVSGSSDGTIGYYVDPYVGDGESLTGTITIGDKVVYITQRAYDASISPSAATVGGNAGAGEFGFSADIDDVWTALDILCSKDWITTAQVTSFNAATKSGTIRYTYAANDSGVPRTGTIVVAGGAYQLTQSARQVARIEVEVEGRGGEAAGVGDYDVGASVVLIATPSDGFEFAGWYRNGSQVATSARYSFSASVNAKYIAKFAAIPTYVVNGEVVRRGTVVSCAAPADRIDEAGTTKLVCRGTSAYPEKGASFTLVASEDVAFEWDLWTTNYLVTADGVASWCPAGSVKTLTPKVPSGQTFFRWTGDVARAETSDNPLRLVIDGPKTITSVSGTFVDSLTEALDAPALTFRTGGDGAWTAAVDALAPTGYVAASATAAPESDVWLETTLEGSGTLVFDWRTDCEHDDSGACEWDRLAVFVNGIEKARIDGTVDYQHVMLPIAGEKSVIRWSFYRDEHDETGSPAIPRAWVDGIRWMK